VPPGVNPHHDDFFGRPTASPSPACTHGPLAPLLPRRLTLTWGGEGRPPTIYPYFLYMKFQIFLRLSWTLTAQRMDCYPDGELISPADPPPTIFLTCLRTGASESQCPAPEPAQRSSVKVPKLDLELPPSPYTGSCTLQHRNQTPEPNTQTSTQEPVPDHRQNFCTPPHSCFRICQCCQLTLLANACGRAGTCSCNASAREHSQSQSLQLHQRQPLESTLPATPAPPSPMDIDPRSVRKEPQAEPVAEQPPAAAPQELPRNPRSHKRPPKAAPRIHRRSRAGLCQCSRTLRNIRPQYDAAPGSARADTTTSARAHWQSTPVTLTLHAGSSLTSNATATTKRVAMFRPVYHSDDVQAVLDCYDAQQEEDQLREERLLIAQAIKGGSQDCDTKGSGPSMG
jgi:hypothetical protein